MRRAASDFGWIFFNAERFIQEAIQSTSELLLVDDACSTDESTAIGGQYAEQRPEQVRYRDHARLLTMGPILTLLRGQLPIQLRCHTVLGHRKEARLGISKTS